MATDGIHKEADQVYIGEESRHYGAKVFVQGTALKCLSKKQLKALYPGKQYQIVGEQALARGKDTTGILEYQNVSIGLAKYQSHNRIAYREKGYVRVGEDRFAAFLKNVVFVRIAAVVVCLALIAAGVYAAVTLTAAEDPAAALDEAAAQTAAGQALPDLEEGAVDWEGAQPRDTGSVAQGIAIPGYKSITIDAGATQVRVNLQNPQGNPCYFVISLVLDDGTVLYKSKMIEPGKGLYEIALSQPLEAGEYPAMVKYETFSLEGLAPLNGAEVKITLIAE